jgi:hypothetical protein
MKAQLLQFGRLEIDGEIYERDVVIDRGKVSRRRKGPSKQFRDEFGHTPLSAAEVIPWSTRRLIIGTGADGQLPVMPEVYEEARRRGVEIVTKPTREACLLVSEAEDSDDGGLAAILHVTC